MSDNDAPPPPSSFLSYTPNGLPVLDMALLKDDDEENLVVERVMRRFGGFLMVNYDAALRQSLHVLNNDGRRFFALPETEKCKCLFDHFRGYTPFRAQNTAAFYDGLEGRPADRLEALTFGSDEVPKPAATEAGETFGKKVMTNVNQYPEQPPTLKNSVQTCFKLFQPLGERLMTMFSRAMGMSPDFLHNCSRNASPLFKLSYYPALEDNGDNYNNDRLLSHVDTGPIAISKLNIFPNNLVHPDAPGLQIKCPALSEQGWISVDGPPDSLLTFIGDCLERLTNSVWKGVPHRVISPTFNAKGSADAKSDRLSIAYFPQLDMDILLKPLEHFVTDRNPKMFERDIPYHEVFANLKRYVVVSQRSQDFA